MTLPQSFRMLAIPFSGPIPKAGTPGLDLDGEYFDRHTETGLTPYSEVKVLFHHGRDPLKFMKNARLGTASEWYLTRDGWRCRVELEETPHVELVQLLSRRVPIYGSTATSDRVERDGPRIKRWIVDELSLSPSPQNLFSIPYEDRP
jgi:hypothetical protein